MLLGFPAADLILLSVLIFFAGVVDALAGGGGLITLPAYLAAGLNPALVLGTNKLAGTIGTAASSLNYRRKLRFSLKTLGPAIAATLIGAFLGGHLATLMSPRWIRPLLLAAMPVLAYFLYSKHSFGKTDRSAELGEAELRRRYALIALPIGCYDGFFGPGTGTFLALAYARFCRHDLLAATARAKILNLASNASALAAFLMAGRVHAGLGLAMGAVSVGGNVLGSHLGLKKGAQAIRPAVLLVCAGLFLKILADTLARP